MVPWQTIWLSLPGIELLFVVNRLPRRYPDFLFHRTDVAPFFNLLQHLKAVEVALRRHFWLADMEGGHFVLGKDFVATWMCGSLGVEALISKCCWLRDALVNCKVGLMGAHRGVSLASLRLWLPHYRPFNFNGFLFLLLRLDQVPLGWVFLDFLVSFFGWQVTADAVFAPYSILGNIIFCFQVFHFNTDLFPWALIGKEVGYFWPNWFFAVDLTVASLLLGWLRLRWIKHVN